MQLNPYDAPQSQLSSTKAQKNASSRVKSSLAVSLLFAEILLLYFGYLKYPALMWAAFALSLAGMLYGLLKQRPWLFMLEFVMFLIVSLGLYVEPQLFILDSQEVLDSLYGNAPSPR